MWINPPCVFFWVRNLAPRTCRIKSIQLSNALVAENKQKKKRESEPRTRDLQSPCGDFSETKNLWQVTHNPEDEEKDGEKRGETGKGRFISFFWHYSTHKRGVLSSLWTPKPEWITYINLPKAYVAKTRPPTHTSPGMYPVDFKIFLLTSLSLWGSREGCWIYPSCI